MSNANVSFDFEGRFVKIQCSTDDKMKDICQKYVNKIGRNLNSLIFLYGGSNLNFELSFKYQANVLDKERNEMCVLVYKNEDELSCPKCGEKIKLNSEKINDIKTLINNINDMLKGAKFTLDYIIKISSEEAVKFQLKNFNLVFNSLNEDINKLNKKFDDLLNATNINKELNIDTNYIIAEINIKDENINKDIKILGSYEESIRGAYLKKFIENDNYKNEDEIKQCEITINDKGIPFNYYHNFKSKGKYIIKYYFKNHLKSTCLLFGGCKLLIKIDLFNFNTNNTIYMYRMFSECKSLTNIDLSKNNTNNVADMCAMFYGCSSLTNINLSKNNTNNVTIMGSMFSGCSSLAYINLSNFNTNNVTNMFCMFFDCSSLTNINLSNFNTNNVTNMSCMFFGCSKLRKENVITKDKNILYQLD